MTGPIDRCLHYCPAWPARTQISQLGGCWVAGAAHSANWAHADNQEWFLSLIVVLVFPSFSILFISMFNNLPFWLGKQPNKCLAAWDHWRPPAMVMCLMRADSNNYNNRQRVAKTNPRPVPAIKQLKPLASQHSINCPICSDLPVPDKISSQLSLRCLCFCGRGITPKTGSTPPLFSNTDFHTFHNKVKKL